jgi:hypothetical protein
MSEGTSSGAGTQMETATHCRTMSQRPAWEENYFPEPTTEERRLMEIAGAERAANRRAAVLRARGVPSELSRANLRALTAVAQAGRMGALRGLPENIERYEIMGFLGAPGHTAESALHAMGQGIRAKEAERVAAAEAARQAYMAARALSAEREAEAERAAEVARELKHQAFLLTPAGRNWARKEEQTRARMTSRVKRGQDPKPYYAKKKGAYLEKPNWRATRKSSSATKKRRSTHRR